MEQNAITQKFMLTCVPSCCTAHLTGGVFAWCSRRARLYTVPLERFSLPLGPHNPLMPLAQECHSKLFNNFNNPCPLLPPVPSSGSKLSGQLPPLFSWRKVKTVQFSENALTGSLPASLMKLESMTFLDFT